MAQVGVSLGPLRPGVPGVPLAPQLPEVQVVRDLLLRHPVHLLLLGHPGSVVSTVLQVAGVPVGHPPLPPRGLPGRPVRYVTEGYTGLNSSSGRRVEFARYSWR